MNIKKNIIENIDGFAMFALIWAFIINLAVLLINLFRYYILESASWYLIRNSFEIAVLIIIALVVLLAVISPLYQKLVKATKVQNESQLENDYFRRKTRTYISEMFECSRDEARAIAKFWEQMSLDFVKLAAPSICTPTKIFDEAEKAQEWQQNCSAYLGGSSFMFDPRKSLKLRMFKRAASIEQMLQKIRDFCASTPSIVSVSEAEILIAYDEYITAIADKTGQKDLCESLTKGMEHYRKIIANRKAGPLLGFYKDQGKTL